MKKTSMTLVQILLVVVGILVAGALLWEPTVEGVNANATSISDIYFDDPFLAYIYFSFIAVFISIYQAFKLAGYIGRGVTLSEQSVKALRTIKYCALAFAGLIFAAVVYLVVTVNGKDDVAGGVAIGLFFTIASLIAATTAAVFEKKLKKSR